MSNKKTVPSLRFRGFSEPWEEKRISDVAEICTGGTPSTNNERYWFPKEIPWLSSGEIHKKQITYTDDSISIEGMNNSSAKIIPQNSVLIALAGQGKTRGTVAINQIPLTTNQSVAAMIFSKQIIPEFILCNLENRYEEIRKMSSSDGSRGGLNKQIVGDINIPYILVAEQKQIGQFFSNLDRLIALEQQKYDKLNTVKQSMLEKMFPQKGAKLPEIRFKGFSEPWEEKKLGEIAPLRGGFAFKSSQYDNNGIPIIRISNILSDGCIGNEFIYYHEQQNDEVYSLSDAAVLIAMSGATTGKVAILHEKKSSKYYQNQRVGYFVPTLECDYGFIAIIVRSHFFSKQLSAVLVAGAQPNVSSKDIDSFEFLIPVSKEEQQAIGSYFQNLDRLITLQNRKIEKLRNLKKACLEKMFV